MTDISLPRPTTWPTAWPTIWPIASNGFVWLVVALLALTLAVFTSRWSAVDARRACHPMSD
ncbi:MAG: hypothetical protein WCC81_21065 [Pseudolabrys sp.]